MAIPSAPLVLILRFRDLVAPQPGHTVSEHNKIAAQRGYTWWGWWKKQTEEIPVKIWSEIARQSKTGGSPAFLLDSGQRKLYSTRILAVAFNPDHSLMPPPEDGVATPDYYNPRGNPISQASWFKIETIVAEDGEEKLLELMFAEPPHDDLILATDKDFENRRMGGVNQLLTFGNVTYWVGTPASKNALSPLERLDARLLDPIAPRDIIRSESPRILHISDIHLSAMHAFPVEGDAHQPSLAAAIYDAVKGDKVLPGIVIVSGDLTWSGSREEFELAFKCLNAIRSTLGLTKQHFVIVPGNHDLQWTRKQSIESSYEFDGQVEVASEDAQANYAEFFKRWYGTPPNEFLSMGRRFFLMGGPTLDVIGLNSVALQQMEGQFSGVGRVTERAFDETASRMGWTPDGVRATELRAIVVHHHVLPVVGKERPKDMRSGFGIALDAGSQVVRALRHQVDIVLHGHQHQPFAGYLNREEPEGEAIDSDRGLLVVGAGSAGVKNDHLGPINQRAFNSLVLHRNEVQLDLYSTRTAPDEFGLAANKLVAKYGHPWRRTAL